MKIIKSCLGRLLTIVILLFTGSQGINVTPKDCIRCICAEGCAFTHDYWLDGGKPGTFGFGNQNTNPTLAYTNCLNDIQCSTRTVINYMSRYKRDCNSDGIIDCYDFAAIHRMGPFACQKQLPKQYFHQVRNCLITVENSPAPVPNAFQSNGIQTNGLYPPSGARSEPCAPCAPQNKVQFL